MTTRRQALRTLAAGLSVTLVPLPKALRAQDFTVIKQGSFAGESGHATSGAAAIVERDGRHFVSLGLDFAFDGAPDPKVALGSDGYRADSLLGPLETNVGAQSYPLPAELDPVEFNEVWLWCEEFDVPLGRAALR
jgi:hypothetical protein